MPPSRREFLVPLVGLPLTFLVGCSNSGFRQADLINAIPNVKNLKGTGQYLVTEGKTLLVNLVFPTSVKDLSGNFPVKIQPESFGGKLLTETQPLFFISQGDDLVYRALLSAPLDVLQGRYTANLAGLESTGRAEWIINYTVLRGSYKQTEITVDKEFSEPSREIARLTRDDFETMLKLYSGRTARAWKEPFIHPVQGPDLDNFGDRRTYNEVKHARHSGLDYRAQVGTPIFAINDGKVVLSGEQWVPGKTICLDHGGGVFSKYLHLSERRAQLGETVKRGQVIGLTGKSGGQKPPSHLHLDLVLNGVRVDPKDFMRTASELIALETKSRPAPGISSSS